MFVGGGASAEVRTLLEERDAEAGVGKSAARGESGESSADDGDGFGTLRVRRCNELRLSHGAHVNLRTSPW
jgi:hypothetical protein